MGPYMRTARLRTLACSAVAGIAMLAACTTPGGPIDQRSSRSADLPVPVGDSQSPIGLPTASIDATTPGSSRSPASELPSSRSESDPPSSPVVGTSLTPDVSPSPHESVDVSISHVGVTGESIEVSGYVAVVEDGGWCSAVAHGAAGSAVLSGPSFPDATTTSCGTLVIETAGLGAPPWTIQLSYESHLRAGTSTPTEVRP